MKNDLFLRRREERRRTGIQPPLGGDTQAARRSQVATENLTSSDGSNRAQSGSESIQNASNNSAVIRGVAGGGTGGGSTAGTLPTRASLINSRSFARHEQAAEFTNSLAQSMSSNIHPPQPQAQQTAAEFVTGIASAMSSIREKRSDASEQENSILDGLTNILGNEVQNMLQQQQRQQQQAATTAAATVASRDGSGGNLAEGGNSEASVSAQQPQGHFGPQANGA